MSTNAVLDSMKTELNRYKQELDNIIIELNKLDNKKSLLEGQIKTANDFISLAEGKLPSSEKGPIQLDLDKEFAIFDPKPAYIEIAKKYFKNQMFTEEQLWKLAKEKGVRTKNGEIISRVYSRNIVSTHVQKGVFEKIKAGLYKLISKDAEEISSADKSSGRDVIVRRRTAPLPSNPKTETQQREENDGGNI